MRGVVVAGGLVVLMLGWVLRRTMSGGSSKAFSMVFVTAPKEEVAKSIAGILVKEKLAACVNIIPSVTSIYEWEGKLEEDKEVIMMIKTRTERVDDIVDEVKKNHPYDVPEVISAVIDNGSGEYLEFIAKGVLPKKE